MRAYKKLEAETLYAEPLFSQSDYHRINSRETEYQHEETNKECRKAGRRGRGRTRKVVQMFSSMGLKRKEFMNNTDGAQIVRASHFDQEYALGHKITLICIATGVPPPRITWHREKLEIVAHPFLQIKSKLEIDPGRQMDEGTFTCQASNKYGVQQKHFKVGLVEPEFSS
ncbi:immunoglobulin domain-containing protein oig-4-like isoform X2 [Brevipalpus obovatus]|uniref:immunoglobulin domain-containing protein oig-4-like isoform X2 n=1 Tax=Brevipalpus obovatus TaxID=246614 RepID=UPI003D9F9D23